jgi:hypothetical protein
MSKYDPLGHYLRQRNAELVPMRFEEIERIIGSRLPESKHYPAWWSNNASNNVMTKVWLDAGYRSEQVDISGRQLVFRRVAPPKGEESPVVSTPAPSEPADVDHEGPARRHPLFGALKGLLRVMPGTDLTKPADPSWGEK